MLIKAGVDISRLNPEIRGALGTVQVVLDEFVDELVVTSTYDGNHLPNSYHYGNDAFDFTGRYKLRAKWITELQKKLPDYFDVVFESHHIHVELDRRKLNDKTRG